MQSFSDECEGYLTEDRWQRSVGNKIKTGSKENFCDSLLVSSWYRFMSKAGTDMPNSCPSKHSCGKTLIITSQSSMILYEYK